MLTTIPDKTGGVKSSFLLQLGYCLTISSFRRMDRFTLGIHAFLISPHRQQTAGSLWVACPWTRASFRGVYFLKAAPLHHRAHAGDWWRCIRKKQPIPEYNWVSFIMVVMSHVMRRNGARLAHQSPAGRADRPSEGCGGGRWHPSPLGPALSNCSLMQRMVFYLSTPESFSIIPSYAASFESILDMDLH